MRRAFTTLLLAILLLAPISSDALLFMPSYVVPSSSPSISLVAPVTCTPIASGCAGTVGDAQGTSLGTLVPSSSGGSPGTITCNTTMPNSQGGRFQITAGCVLQAGATAYSASTWTVTVAFSGSLASANPYNLSFTVTVNGTGGVTLAQQRIINNLSGSSTVTANLDLAVQFGDGQVPAGDSVIAKTGAGASLPMQADNCSYYVSGALKQCSMTVQYPSGLANNATDAIGFYDNPSSSFNNSCFTSLSNVVTALTVSHDYRLTVGVAGTPYTFSVNNEFANEAATHALVYRSGPLDCSYKVYGEIRAGPAFGDTPQGQAWVMLYIDYRIDGTVRINGSVIGCRPLNTSGTTTTTCPVLALTPDTNGNVYALQDFISGSGVVLAGCDASGCTINGNAGGTGFNIYGGYEDFLLAGNAFGYDSGPDIHNIIPAFPDCVSANAYTCGVALSHMVTPGIFSTANEKTYIAANPIGAVSYAPLFCSPLYGPTNCAYGTTGAHVYVGYQTGMWVRCFIAGATSAGATECLSERIAATMSGSVQLQWRDANTGSPPVMTSFYSIPTGTAGLIPTLKDAHTVSWGTSATISLPSFPAGHAAANNHQPDFWMGSCITWGEQWMCDRVVDEMIYDIGAQNPGFRNPNTINGPSNHAYGGILGQQPQMRMSAWTGRNQSNALAVLADFLTDGITTIANPVKAFVKMQVTCGAYVASGTPCATVDGGSGNLAYLADFLTGTWFESGQTALGWFWSGNPAHTGESFTTVGPSQTPHNDMWQTSYAVLAWGMQVLRGELSASHPLISMWGDTHAMGMSVNGCPVNAPMAYNYSITAASSGLFSTNQASTNLAQSWADVQIGTMESGTIPIAVTGEPLMSFDPGQAPGVSGTTTIIVDFSKPSSVSQAQFEAHGVGMQFAFVIAGYSLAGGFAVPHQTTVVSVTNLSTTQDTVVLSAPITGPAPVSFTAQIDPTPTTLTASITGTSMVVTAASGGSLQVGSVVAGAGVTPGTVVAVRASGGGVGTYTVSPSQTVSSEAMTSGGTPTVMTVSAVASGALVLNGQVVGAGVAPNTLIVSQTSGTTGSTGTYTLGTFQTVASEAMTSNSLPTSTSQATFMQWNGGDNPVTIDPNFGARVPLIPAGGCPSTIASPVSALALTTAQVNGSNNNYLVAYNAAAIIMGELGNADGIAVRDYWQKHVANAALDPCAGAGSGTWDTNGLWPARSSSSVNGWMVNYAPFNIVAPVCRP